MKRIVVLLSIVVYCIALWGCGTDNGTGNKMVNSSKNDFASVKAAGYYSDLRVMPNGEFLVHGQLKDEDAGKSGLVYKVEMNEKKQISKITAMDGDKPINATWADTLNECYVFAIVTMEYQDGYVKYAFKDAQLSACKGLYKAYAIRYKYDEKKKAPIIAYLYDKNGEQRNDMEGFSQILFDYDDKGKLVKLGYSDRNGERLTTNNANGHRYEIRLKYDTDKRTILPIEISNYGKDGSLMTDANGIAKTTYMYDTKGRLTEVKHFGTDENLKVKSTKYAEEVLLQYDPVFLAFGAITKYIYDDNCNKPAKIMFLGKDEQSLALDETNQCAALSYTYTSEGRVESISLFGTDDMPCTWKGTKVARFKRSYDIYGNREQIAFYGKDNNLVTLVKDNPTAIEKKKYNDKRQVVEIAYFGTDENPVEIRRTVNMTNNKKYSIHREVYDRDENGNLKVTYFYNKNGEKVAQRNH